MANKDVLKISFDASSSIKELERDLIGSMGKISDEISDKLESAFSKAGRNPKLKKQLTGVYQGLFDELSSASGNIDKVNAAIDSFAGKIDYINTIARKSKIPGIFDNLSIENVNKILQGYDKIIEKNKKIAEFEDNKYKDNIRKSTTVKSLKDLEKVYKTTSEAKLEYNNKISEYVKESGIEVDVISKEIKEYSSLIALFEKINNTKVTTGSEDAIKKSQSLLYVMKEIEKLETGNTLFSNFRKNNLTEIDNITSSIQSLTLHGVEGSITSFVNNLKKPLKAEIKKIYDDVVGEILKMSKHQSLSAEKTQLKVNKAIGVKGDSKQSSVIENLGNEIHSLEQDLENDNIFSKYFDTTNKSAEELEDTFYNIGDQIKVLYKMSEDGDLVGEDLKKFVGLYKQLEDLAGKIDGFSVPKQYKEEYEFLLKNNKELTEYANKLDNIRKQGYSKKQESHITETKQETKIDDSKVEELRKEITETKNDIISLKNRVDTLEDTTAFDKLSSKVDGFDEKIKNVDGSVENLVNSFKLLSELSLTELQKVVIPFFNGINQVYKENNGNQISGYWDKVKKEVEGSNTELKEFLKLVGLYNSEKNGLNIIQDGMENSGGLIGDDKVLIARKNKRNQFEDKSLLKRKLDEAYEAGINVARILDIIGTKESKVFFDIQEKAKGQILSNPYGQNDTDFINTEWFEASEQHIKKLVSDMIELQKMGINVESNLTNIMYDKEKGFSFIDMDLDTTQYQNDAELMQEHMMRIFSGLEEYYEDRQDNANLAMVEKARERFENLSKEVQQAYAEAQDSNSPSKEFEKLEDDAVEGIIASANKNEEKLKNVGRQMAENIKDGFKEGISDFENILQETTSKDESVKSEKPSLEELSSSSEKAAEAKIAIKNANEQVQDSVDESKSKLELETELMERLAIAARQAADAKKEFVEANEKVKKSVDDTSNNINNDTYSGSNNKKEPENPRTSPESTKYNKEVVANYKSLIKSASEYYDLKERNTYGALSKEEIIRLNELDDLWERATKKLDEYSVSLNGSKDSIRNVQRIQEKFINEQDEIYKQSLEGYIADTKKNSGKIRTTPDKYTDSYLSELKTIDDLLENIRKLAPIDLTDETKVKEVANYKRQINEILESAKDDKNTLAKSSEVYKLQADIFENLQRNSGMSSKLKAEFNALGDELASYKGKIPNSELERFRSEFQRLRSEMEKAGKVGKDFFGKIKDKIVYGWADIAARYLGLQDVIRYIQNIGQKVTEYNSKLTEMRKVSDETVATLKEFQRTSFDLADGIGATADAIQNSTADFMRLGYELEDADDLAVDANIYANVGDMEIEEATEHMISSIQAWKSEFSSEVEASSAIIDRYNEIGNNFAITSADIGSAMERSAAALKAGGNTLNESLGLITAGNLIQQDADTTANALKVVSLRIRGSKADLEAMGESTDDLAESSSKCREELKALTGVDIMLDEKTYKSTAQIIQEIGENWTKLTDVSQAATLELLAGENICLKFMETYFYRTHLNARIA